jgi:hypothetical protein
MLKCRVPAVIIAVALGGIGLSACGTSASSSSAAVTAPTSSAAAVPTSSLTDTPSSSPSPTASKTASASATATHKASAKATSSAHSTSGSSTASCSHSAASGDHTFNIPPVSGSSLVCGWGAYSKIGSSRVKLTICAKQMGAAFSVGTQGLVYSSSGSSKDLGAVILTGPGEPTCVSQTFILYTAHLKVHSFIGGTNGTIAKTGPTLTVY